MHWVTDRHGTRRLLLLRSGDRIPPHGRDGVGPGHHLPAWLPELTLTNLRVGEAVATIRFFRIGTLSAGSSANQYFLLTLLTGPATKPGLRRSASAASSIAPRSR